MPVTLITVTYNSSSTITSFIHSIFKSGNPSLIREIIIVENNSPDKVQTIKNISSLQKIYPKKIRLVVSKLNGGFAKSCNLGARLTRSDYLLFINPDIKVQKNSIQTLFDHMVRSQADIIGGVSKKNHKIFHKTVVRHPTPLIGLFEFTNLGKLLNIHKGHSDFYYEDIEGLYSSSNDIKVEAVGGAYLMCKRKSFNLLKGFDEKFFMYLEDVDLGHRANLLGMNVIFCSHSTVWHIGGASSKNKHHIHYKAWSDSRRYYFKKHYGYYINILLQSIFKVEEFLLEVRKKYI